MWFPFVWKTFHTKSHSLPFVYIGEDCALPGSIPSNLIARKTSLEYIKLQDCDLVGNIPTVFGRLSNLTHIDLSENDLVGKLPTQIAQLSKLSRFDVYNNQLTGAIPRFRSLSNLQLLDLVSSSAFAKSYCHVHSLSHH